MLYYLFTHYGEIVSIRIVRDETGQHKVSCHTLSLSLLALTSISPLSVQGYGFVLFNTPTAAQSALEEMHHRKVGPRKIHVSISTHKKSDEPFLAPSASSRAESALNWRPRPDNPSAGLGPWAQVSAVSSLIRPGKEDDPFSAQFEGMKLTDRDHRDREQSDGSDAEIENGTVLAKVGFPQFGKVMVEKIVRQPQMQLPSLGAAGGKTGYAKAIIAGVKVSTFCV